MEFNGALSPIYHVFYISRSYTVWCNHTSYHWVHFRFGYVEFGSEEAAQKIYKMSKGGIDINGSMVTVDFARERGSGGGGRGGGEPLNYYFYQVLKTSS